MSIIYEPKGRAKEYAELAVNLYRGCGHGCVYCYAPAATFTDREKFYNQVAPRKNVLEQLEKDIEKYRGDSRQILLSFTSDPYQPVEEELQITRRALSMMIDAGLRVTVLTKNGDLAPRDFDILARSPHSEFAVSLTTFDPGGSEMWEPGASLPAARINALKLAFGQGIRTWVSFEPVIYPAAVYKLIGVTHPFVDLYKVGKLNYHPHAKIIDWPRFRRSVVVCLEAYHKEYLIKRDLLEAK